MSDAEQSPNIYFRELDAEFLTQQARIWLEAVLGQRFDQETSLGDLLADGEILHKVASTVQTLMQGHADGEPASPKSLYHEGSYDGTHSGKYLPYSNVDAFLKVCQKLGLTGVDLFSPSDVVDKTNIRGVCLCIRMLSKKARARQLGVPNFDHVTHTVPMPTEVVGGLRESLKHASNSPSVSRNSENRESPRMSQVRSGSLLSQSPGDAGVPAESAALASSDDSGGTAKESGTDYGYNGTGDKDKISLRISQDRSMSQTNSDFLRGSRSTSLFDDETHLSEDSSIETRQELPAEELADRGVNDSLDRGKSKKKRVWVPFVAAVVALIGAAPMIRAREPLWYEVKKGDTLSQIAKRTGKPNWEELVRLNPGIRNPDLIYPDERLRLRT